MGEVDGSVLDLASSDLPPVPASKEPASQSAEASTNPSFTNTLATDNGLSKRPRDARILHMVLANLGVTAYQERVPLQLMDFAYRYTSSTLQDALHLTSEGYGNSGHSSGAGRVAGNHNDMSSLTLSSLRLSIASRTHYQFNPNLSKDFYHEIAKERNRVALPPVSKDWGMRLPPDQYCLTGVGWGLREEWDSEGDEGMQGDAGEDQTMMELSVEDEGEGDGEEDDNERMEDIFGNGPNPSDKDTNMDGR